MAAGNSGQLLQSKGIEAPEKLAASPKTRVNNVGAEDNGVPIILDADKRFVGNSDAEIWFRIRS